MFRTFGRTCNQLLSPGPVKMMSLRLQFHCLRFQKPFGMVRIVLDTAETKWTPSEKQALFQFSFFGGGSRFCDHWMIAAAFFALCHVTAVRRNPQSRGEKMVSFLDRRSLSCLYHEYRFSLMNTGAFGRTSVQVTASYNA